MLTNTTHTVGLVFCSRATSLHNDLYRPTVLNRLCLSPSLLYHTLPQLATKSDVLLENYPPGKLDAFGLGYAALSAANPRLVYCSITGYGPTGPKSHRLGYDVVASAESGLMHVTGPKVRGGGGKEGREGRGKEGKGEKKWGGKRRRGGEGRGGGEGEWDGKHLWFQQSKQASFFANGTRLQGDATVSH